MYTMTRTNHLDANSTWELSQHLRRSRATLGSVLEWLESDPRDPEMLERLQGYAEDVAAEIDRLVEAIATLPAKDKR